jgi:pSer/pThr/pTyr-binding forkhead associated (FHA) protein
VIVLQQLSGQNRGRRAEFRDGPVLLGRSPDAELRFDAHADIDVSARHAVLERDGDRWILRDIGSRNGTFVGGKRIRERVLFDRDEIELGHGGPRLHVSIPSEAGSRLEHADTEPGRSIHQPPSASAPGPRGGESDEATRVVSHEAETVVLSAEAPTVVAASPMVPSVAPDAPTRQERPSAKHRADAPEASKESAQLRASLRRTRLVFLGSTLVLLAAVAALALSR